MPGTGNNRGKAAVSAREQKKTEKDADAVTTGFALVMDEAVETELAYVTNQLRQKPGITHTLAALLKSNSLQALLDGNTTKALSASKPGVKVMTLRKTSKRFKHLAEQPAVITDLLQTLEPGWYTGDGAERIDTRTVTSVHQYIGVIGVSIRVIGPHRYRYHRRRYLHHR